MNLLHISFSIALCLALTGPANAGSGTVKSHESKSITASAFIKGMTKAATGFLGSLNAPQRLKAKFPWQDKGRAQMHYVPMQRSGLSIGALSNVQKKLLHALLRTGLSASGHNKTKDIMALEDVLAVYEKDPKKRNSDLYYISIFGEPNLGTTWGFKFEGHHLSLNFTVVNGKITQMAPTFLGSNPAHVRKGEGVPRRLVDMRVLKEEEDLARKFLLSLPPKMRQAANMTKRRLPKNQKPSRNIDPLGEILSSQEAVAVRPNNFGILFPAMPPAAQKNLQELVRAYAEILAADIAALRLKKVKTAGYDKVRFAWGGAIESGRAKYYRIVGPSFMIEFVNKSGGNHIHAVWRDFKGDFGRDALREHLQKHPH